MKSIAYTRGNRVIQVPLGFSWTTLLFGQCPSMIRGHWPMAWAVWGINIIGLVTSFLFFEGRDDFMACIAARVFCAAIRNKFLHHFIVSQGWVLGLPAQVIQFQHAVNDQE